MALRAWCPRHTALLSVLIAGFFLIPTAFVGVLSVTSAPATAPTASASAASARGYTVTQTPEQGVSPASPSTGAAGPELGLLTAAGSVPMGRSQASPTPAAALNLTVSPTSGPVGQDITFTGINFAHKSAVTLSWSYGTVCSVTANSTGGFQCIFNVTHPAKAPGQPYQGEPYGPWVFTATGAGGGHTETTFRIIPSLYVAPTQAPTSTDLGFNGTGFTADSTVKVTWSVGTACTAATDRNGSFPAANCTYILPPHVPAKVVFEGKDGAGHTANASFTILPVLVAVPSSGPVGGVISFLGTNYTPHSRVNVSLNSTIVCTGISNATGAVDCAFTTPQLPAGEYVFIGTDNHTNAAKTTFQLVPRLSPGPSSGPVGTRVVFSGTGFADDSVVTVSYPSGTVCVATSSLLGSFSCSFVMPALIAGAHEFTAANSTSKRTAETSFDVTSQLTATPPSGPVGTSVAFEGTGYAAGSPVTVSWTDGTICSTTTAANGSFACPLYTIPSTSKGTHTFTGTDAADNSATTTFTVATQLLATPNSGPVGTSITFRGSNYSADVAVSVTWSSGAACSSTTNATGSFVCTFVLTNASVGPQVFTGTDAAGNFVTDLFTVTPFLTPSPAAGPVGSTVVFSGTGFAATSLVTVTWTSITACTATTDSFGSFRCSFVIRPQVQGTDTFTATDGIGDSALATVAVTPELVPIPASGPVGTAIKFVGSGYAADSDVSVGWSGGVACSPTTTETNLVGNFTCTFVLPSVTAGAHPFVGTDGASNTATAVFTAVPSVSVSPTQGIAGTYTKFSGLGFAAASAVTVASSIGTACTATTNSTGAFSCTYYIPSVTPQAYRFTATDASSNAATVTFTVLPLTLKVSPTSGVVGSSVTFSGTNWADSSTVTVSWSGGKVCTSVPTSGSGSFSCAVTIPAMTAGPHTFTATDATGNTTSVAFSVDPRLTATPTSGQVGTLVTFAGTGFAGSSATTVSWAQGEACSATTDASGGFRCTFVIPATTARANVFEGTDASSNVAVTTVTVVPTLSINDTAGPVGTTVTFNGTGFAGTSLVIVSWVEGTACSATSSALGNFSCSFEITSATAGVHPFGATDASGNTASAGFTIVPRLVPTPGVVPDATSVTFGGTGFAGNSSVTITWVVGMACTATTSAVGSFNCTYLLADTTPGYYTFNATDHSTDTAFAIVQVVPGLTDVPASDPVGDVVTFSAAGFAASSAITITWAHGTACSGTTSSVGAFVCAFTVTATTPGGYVFTATDHASNSASVVFVVTPFLSASPGFGPVGTLVTLTGTNYAPDATVTISFGGSTACSGRANATGAFACTFTVPVVVGGAHAFTSVDSSGNAASALFTVTAQLSVSPGSGPVGTAAVFSGTGFEGTRVVVTLNGRSACSSPSSSGTFSCTYVIPTDPSTTLSFLGTDNAKIPDRASVTFRVTPTLTVTPSSGPVGSAVTFTGSAYAANESVTVTWAGGTVCIAIANATGNFTCTFTIPSSINGEHVFNGTDLSGNTALTEFEVNASLRVSPSSATVGTVLTLVGAGYDPDSAVSVVWGGGTVCATTTNVSGGFLCEYTLSAVDAGPHAFLATDGEGATAMATLVVVPSLSESVASGPVGTTVTFTGMGFAATSAVNVTWAAGIACSATTDASGTFSCAFQVSAAVEGAHTFTAKDGSKNSATSTFAVTPTLTASPSSASVGVVVTFSGTGYAASSLVAVSWAAGTACTQTTSSVGSFSCTFLLPPSTEGAHTFTATDRSSNAASTVVTVTPLLTVSPTSGLQGVVITFTAQGFAASSTISISWSRGTPCLGETNASGTYSCTVTIPTIVAGPYVFTAEDAALNSAVATFTVTPLLTVGTVSGPVGTVVVFTGSDYAADSAVTVSWSGGTACLATTNASGGFTCSFTVSAAIAGSHTFTASDASGNSATVGFVVTTRLTVTAAIGPVGTVVTFQGTGYDSSSALTITWGEGTACTTTTNPLGSFSCTYTLPSSPAGAHSFTGSDAGGAAAVATFTVTPQLSIDLTSGPVGTALTFTADGFAAGSTLGITWLGGTVCTGTTDADGELSCPYTIPATAPGGYLFTAKDGASNSAVAAFTIVPLLTVGPVSGPVGTTVTFTGTNFAVDSSVSVTEGGTTLCTTTTNGTGAFACTAVVPPSTAGSHVFTATDGSGNAASTSFTVTSHLSVSAGTDPVGATITFDGTGYAASELVTVSWIDGVACSATTNANGSFGCSYVLPATTAGAQVFTGADPTGDSATTTVTVTSVLTVSPGSGPVGGTITLTGTGYAGSSAVVVTWAGGTACSTTTSAAGSFSCTLKIPLVTAGSYSFVATDHASDSASALFSVVPALLVSEASGPVGTSVTLSGSGFSSASTVTVSWGATTVCTPTSTANGSFSCTFAIPASTAGLHSFVATDTDLNTASATFTVLSTLSATPSSGPVGSVITFAGTGYAASSSVNVMWVHGAVCSTTTNGVGSFSCTFTIPPTTTGDYAFMGTDGSGNTAMIHVTVVVALTVTPGTGPVGTSVTFTGTGFAPLSSVNVTGLSGIACSATTDASGGFNCTYVIPPAFAGSHAFAATDGLRNSASTRFVVVPSLTVTPASATVGMTITFTGFGFENSSTVNVTWGGGAVCTATSDTKGDFSCTFKLTQATAGSQPFNATDSVGDRAAASMTVTPLLTASPLTAPSGTSIVFQGSGFAGNSYVVVSAAGSIACSTTTSASGSFACTLNHPAVPVGALLFTATDASANTGSVTVTFTAPPSAPASNNILGLDPDTFYTILAFVIIAGVAGILALVVHRGRKGQQPAF
jgi:hypothetical protein